MIGFGMLTIRDISPADEPTWRRLWADYLTFYRTTVPDAITNATWAKLFDPTSAVFGRAAVRDGAMIGFCPGAGPRGRPPGLDLLGPPPRVRRRLARARKLPHHLGNLRHLARFPGQPLLGQPNITPRLQPVLRPATRLPARGQATVARLIPHPGQVELQRRPQPPQPDPGTDGSG